MAIIRNIEKNVDTASTVSRTTSRCSYSALVDGDEILFDLRTFGSKDRAVEGHASQIMQFDRHSARQLYRALRDTFEFD